MLWTAGSGGGGGGGGVGGGCLWLMVEVVEVGGVIFFW